MNANKLPPPPPANEISFARDCFEVRPVVEWVVSPNPGSTAYPERYEESQEAIARESGRRQNRVCHRVETTRWHRVRWN